MKMRVGRRPKLLPSGWLPSPARLFAVAAIPAVLTFWIAPALGSEPVVPQKLAATSAGSGIPLVSSSILDGARQDSVLIRGRVTDSSGRPIVGARVTVDGRTTLSGSNGGYQLRVASSVPVNFRAAAPGYEPVNLPSSSTPRDGDTPVDFVLTEAPYELPTVTVISSPRGELQAVPGAAATVYMARIRSQAPLSLGSAIRTIPGVHIADEDPFALNLNIGFRGLPPRRSSRTLIMEDGVPILLGPYSDPSMHYAPPMEAVDRIEVVKGSGQIMNGPQTVGGIINFVTRSPATDGSSGSVTFSGGGLGYRSGHLAASTGREGRAIAFDYGFRQGEGVRVEQHHRTHNVILGGQLDLGTDHSLVLKTSFWDESSRTSETGLTQAEFEASPFSLPFTLNDHFGVRRWLGQAVHQFEGESIDIVTNAYASRTARASWRQAGESEERIDNPDYPDDFNCAPGATTYAECGNQGRPREYTMFGLEPRVTIDLRKAGRGAVIDLGVRAHLEDVRRRQYTGDSPTAREDHAELTRDNRIETRAVAAFAQARWRTGIVEMTPGLRLENIQQEIGNLFPGSEATGSQSYTQLLPGLGASMAVGDRATVFAGMHRGFAPPRPADIYRPEPGQSLALVDPELSWNWELGARAQTLGLHGEVTLFHMDFSNLIVEAPAGSGQRFVNAGAAAHTGVELNGGISLAALASLPHDVRLDAAYTYLPVARFTGVAGGEPDGNRLPYAPRHLASGTITFAHRGGLGAGASVDYTASQFADGANTAAHSDDGQTGILPAYTVVNPFAHYALPGGRLELRASVRNALDRVYITQRNEGIATGMRRIMRAELQWTF